MLSENAIKLIVLVCLVGAAIALVALIKSMQGVL
jgi:hypothetical protein